MKYLWAILGCGILCLAIATTAWQTVGDRAAITEQKVEVRAIREEAWKAIDALKAGDTKRAHSVLINVHTKCVAFERKLDEL